MAFEFPIPSVRRVAGLGIANFRENGSSMMDKCFWQAHIYKNGSHKFWKTLSDFRLLTPEAAKSKLTSLLMAQIRDFSTREDALPEWRDAARLQDPEEFWSAWSSLPILTKKDLQTRFHPKVIQESFQIKGDISSTGGSTGEPTPFLHDRGMVQASHATSMYCRLQFGWRPGMPLIIIWGSERDIGRQRSHRNRLMARCRNEWLVDGYSLSSGTTDRVLDLIQSFPSCAIWGFSSLLEFVAKQVVEQQIAPAAGRVRMAWNGGEMLYESQSALFQQAFGVPIFNMYGGRELSAMAYQIPHTSSLQVLRPLLFVEVVDDEGRAVKAGETGRLIWTSTVCRGTPFLRYDIGDVGSSDAKDQDESGVFALTHLQGRSGGLVKLQNGMTVGALFWNHFFKDYPEVRQFQVVVVDRQKVELRLLGSPFTPERETRLRSVLAQFLDGIPVNIEWVDRIALTSQGKLLQVVAKETSQSDLIGSNSHLG